MPRPYDKIHALNRRSQARLTRLRPTVIHCQIRIHFKANPKIKPRVILRF